MMMQRPSLQQELEEARLRTDRMFALLSPEAMYERSIPERHRLIFYLGHIEAFDWNQLCRGTLDLPPFHETFDQLFEAGIDPTVGHVPTDSPSDWPKLDEVQRYNARVRLEVDRALGYVPEELIHVAIEHRLMHAETTAYLLHHLDPAYKRNLVSESLCLSGRVAIDEMVEIPDGTANLGRERDDGFGWDNEFGQHDVFVPAFAISRYKVTNERYLRFVEAGGEPPVRWTREGETWGLETMTQKVPLPLQWPVYVTHCQAETYAEWKGLALPTEAQFHRAAYGTPSGVDQQFPWGNASALATCGNFNFQSWDPQPVTAHPQGTSAFGVTQLVGNGWEWTSTLFHPFEGFNPLSTYPGYSTRFFDQDHYVVKGGGPQTAGRLLRRSFRNWFRQGYPYAYTAFRCIKV